MRLMSSIHKAAALFDALKVPVNRTEDHEVGQANGEEEEGGDTGADHAADGLIVVKTVFDGEG